MKIKTCGAADHAPSKARLGSRGRCAGVARHPAFRRMPRAYRGGERRQRRRRARVTASPVRSAAWSAARSAPVSAARWARVKGVLGIPRSALAASAAAAITTATATSAAIAESVHRISSGFAGHLRVRNGLRCASVLQPVAGLEDPPHGDHADGEEAAASCRR